MKGQTCKINSNTPHDIFYEEWLVTNGLGGFACGTIGGTLQRKYHALLNASLKSPLGRTVMLNYALEAIILPDRREIPLTILRSKDAAYEFPDSLVEFKFENNMPTWSYQIEDIQLEKTLWMPYLQNSVYIRYAIIACDGPVILKWRPFLHFRGLEQSVKIHSDYAYSVNTSNEGYEIKSETDFPTLRILNDHHASFTVDLQRVENVYYEIEEKRGYDFLGPLSSPGYFTVTLNAGEKTCFIASTEEWSTVLAMTCEEAIIAERQRQKSLFKEATALSYSSTAHKLILAADQFIITPISREADIVRLKASGEESRSIVAGYPWFTDWGRDTMISLEGLTLVTGRASIAHAILGTFAHYIKDGLIPNMFPEGQNKGLYHTADATLWFFHAVDRYMSYTEDEAFLQSMLPKFQQIINHHIQGTRFGIKMDGDGLLIQGQEGYQLTWMDAKVENWVVTPRRGKAVEINALWYNALKLMEKWTGKTSDLAKLCFESFNGRFWFSEGGYLYDVIEGEKGNDSSLRPNQIFSISLQFPVLKNEYWKPVVDAVKRELVTDYGLRTLSPRDPDFKAYYDGDLWARDAAYHQGTVWPWLIGPFIDAWLKVYPQDKESCRFLDTLEKHIDENCIGTIGEIFDAADPYHARGCFAQAWSVAEFLRAYVKLHPEYKNR
ncbi:glycogen debranching protein [Candidatus Protochlamydia naegleriophila]|uniref:Glycogen debranching protein n=1 Tax=Candidatus Protochlamydia naegleriophila TaxID=389348 RepID=A0A0U5ETD7_9BACT|nr:amylo-alpha-1,6-glucosidase [Candidatus Protochlamydia naegleriophila]CUI17441.1 glycogen debranching protein [Candidatus Protochlamydia naegleriophila]